MAVASSLELAGSPTEQGSLATEPYTWNPAPELAAGATISAPTVKVLQYDPANPAVQTDVSVAALVATPVIANNTVSFSLHALAAGSEYRVQMTCVSSTGETPERYFRVMVKI